jgi:hypothetical protein
MVLIVRIFGDSDETYGHRRVHAVLARQGERCSVELGGRCRSLVGGAASQPRAAVVGSGPWCAWS